jgi:Amt family ammonium transporter
MLLQRRSWIDRKKLWKYGFAVWFIGTCLIFRAANSQPAEGEKAPPAAAEPAKAEAPLAEASAAPDPEDAPYDYKAPTMKSTVEKDGKKEKVDNFPDAEGAKAGTWATPSGPADGDEKNGATTPGGLLDRINHNLFSINMVWVMICGALVMFMQFGFAAVETGLCRAKNSAHTSAMNFMIYPLGCIAFYVYGFGIGWGNWWNAPVPGTWYSPLGPGTVMLDKGYGIDTKYKDAEGKEQDGKWSLIGTKGWFLADMEDVSVLALFFFMMVFMDTTATIPTGTMCERWAWKNFILYGLWVALPYCIFAHWIWGGGWLAQTGKYLGWGHGAVDFAGSSVVHAMGGVIGLIGAIVIGPRIGKFKDGKPQAIPGHDVPMVVFGTFVLAFGWFGFNAGSTLSGTDLRISVVIVNTMLASVFAAFTTYLTLCVKGMKPDPTMLCNGMLAGLVAITAPCAFVGTTDAVIIGSIAGVLVVFCVLFIEKLGVDDPVGAVSVHGICGSFGMLCVGLFANGKYGAGWNGVDGYVVGLFHQGTDEATKALAMGQFKAQAAAVATVWIFGSVMAYVWFKVSNLITPLRVPAQTEIEGCDGPEMGTLGYADFALKSH